MSNVISITKEEEKVYFIEFELFGKPEKRDVYEIAFRLMTKGLLTKEQLQSKENLMDNLDSFKEAAGLPEDLSSFNTLRLWKAFLQMIRIEEINKLVEELKKNTVLKQNSSQPVIEEETLTE